jgi:tryptophanyl-tRNA synthetase
MRKVSIFAILESMKHDTILSGVQATGKLHIGNYLGAVKQFVDIQNAGDMQCFFFVADLHSLTVERDPKQLRADTLEVVAEYIAAGLDPEKSVIFIQNHVLEHAELAWIFNCITQLGDLERMTQYKDKAKQNKENINAGLLTYPTLMAADILIYKPKMVPVGEDQAQHLELARVLARKFNNRYGKVFPEPKNYLLKPLRIMSLKKPDKKMSKTGDDPIYLSDSPADLENKFKKAVTATAGEGSAGVNNLMFLLSHFGTKEQITQFQDGINDGSIKYSELKKTLADDVAEHFAEFREKKKALLADKNRLAEILGDGARRARTVASKTLTEVKEKIGLL